MYRILASSAVAVLLALMGPGCESNQGDGASNDAGVGSHDASGDRILAVCERFDSCDLLGGAAVAQCVVQSEEALSALSASVWDVLDPLIDDCLESVDACDAFEACIGAVFADIDAGVEGPNPPGDCSYTGAACVWNSDCCANHLCVNFGDTTSCAIECTVDSQCVSGCCADLKGGGGACGPASFCEPSNSDPCGDCISACSGLSGCCTGLGCICEDECAVSHCTPPAEFCCGPYDCICTANCPY